MKTELAKLCPEELIECDYYKRIVRQESEVPIVECPRTGALQLIHIWHDYPRDVAYANYRALAFQLERELRALKGLKPGDVEAAPSREGAARKSTE